MSRTKVIVGAVAGIAITTWAGWAVMSQESLDIDQTWKVKAFSCTKSNNEKVEHCHLRIEDSFAVRYLDQQEDFVHVKGKFRDEGDKLHDAEAYLTRDGRAYVGPIILVHGQIPRELHWMQIGTENLGDTLDIQLCPAPSANFRCREGDQHLGSGHGDD